MSPAAMSDLRQVQPGRMPPAASALKTPLFTVTDLCSGYGTSRVLERVSFSMGVEPIAIIGRNGMGKSTLCNTIMGLVPTTSGCVELGGRALSGRHPERIAQAGIAYVPQGRRLFASLTVDEHVAMLAKRARGRRWTPEAVFELFPDSLNGAGAGPEISLVASSRCSPSVGRCSSTGRW